MSAGKRAAGPTTRGVSTIDRCVNWLASRSTPAATPLTPPVPVGTSDLGALTRRRSMITGGSLIAAAERLVKKPWIPALAVTGWYVWAYLHLRPAPSVNASPHPSAAYGPWAFGHMAYSDTLALYYSFHLANHALPYLDTRVEYPVLTGVFMWLAAWVPGVQGYFLASSLGLLVCALGTTYFLHRIDLRLAWAFACCPLLLVYGLLNWDVLAIFLMVAGWERFEAMQYGWAGVLLSLAVWAKFFPIVLLFYCMVSLLRDPTERVHARRMAAWGGAVALLVNLPFAVGNVGNWDHFFVFNVRRGGGGGILYQLHIASALSIPFADVLSGLVVVIAGILLMRPVLRGESPIAAAALAFAVLLLVNKVYSPQYMLWLFTFGLLAEWPGWSLVLMSVAGLVDYADAMIVLYLSHIRSPAFLWVFRTVSPWSVVLRYGSIAIATVAALFRADGRTSPVTRIVVMRRVLADVEVPAVEDEGGTR